MLCDVCQHMFSWKEGAWPWPTDTGIVQQITRLIFPIDETPRTLHGRMGMFHDSGEALRISAESCQICATVWGLLKDDERAWLGAGPNGQEDAWGELFWRLENAPTSSKMGHILNTGEVGAVIFEFRPLGWEYSMWNKKLELIIQEKAEFLSANSECRVICLWMMADVEKRAYMDFNSTLMSLKGQLTPTPPGYLL
jgi:hypothetical protein